MGEDEQKETQANKIPELKQLVEVMLDSPGYIFFGGVLTSSRDAKGNNFIDWHFRRYQFANEDMYSAVKFMIEVHCKDSMIDPVVFLEKMLSEFKEARR